MDCGCFRCCRCFGCIMVDVRSSCCDCEVSVVVDVSAALEVDVQEQLL